LHLSGYASHFAAFFGATPAGLSTFPAVFHTVLCMLFAFFGACIAYLSTFSAKVRSMLTAKAHQLACGITNNSALKVQLNATCKHLYVIFVKA
jgi:hypothetical protein